MKHELSHDTIARQIFDKASSDAKARRKVHALVEYALSRYQERQILLTQDELDQIRPFESIIDFKKEETSLIQKSKSALQKAARRRRLITIAIISILLVFLGIAVAAGLLARQRADDLSTEQANLQKAFADLDSKQDSLETTLKQLDEALLEAKAQRDTARQREIQAELEKAKAIFERNRAEQATRQALANNYLTLAGDHFTKIIRFNNRIEDFKAEGDTSYQTSILIYTDSVNVNSEKAISYCTSALELDRKNKNVYIKKIEIHKELKQWPDGIATCTQAIYHLGSSVFFHDERANLYERNQQDELALDDYEWLRLNHPVEHKQFLYASRQIDYYDFNGFYDKGLRKLEQIKPQLWNVPNQEGAYYYYGRQIILLKQRFQKLRYTGYPGLAALQDSLFNAYDLIINLDISQESGFHYTYLIDRAKFHLELGDEQSALEDLERASQSTDELVLESVYEVKKIFATQEANKELQAALLLKADSLFQAQNYAEAKYNYLRLLPLETNKESIIQQLITCQMVLDNNFQFPTDELIENQWYLENTGGLVEAKGLLKKGADAKIKEAWQFMGNMGSQEVVVAVFDNGFDLQHPDLKTNIYKPFDFWYHSSEITSGDARYSHATPAASIAIARANNGGIVGVAPNATFMPLSGTSFSERITEKAFYYIIEEGADILICPWGTIDSNYKLTERKSAVIKKAATEGRNGKGCIILFAAGNEGGDIVNYYAQIPGVIAVGSSTSKDKHASYSNKGSSISVVAPSNGEWPVIAARASWDEGLNYEKGNFRFWRDGKVRGKNYKHFGGTTTSVAIVGGICALILSENPNLTAAEVKQILEMTADKIGDPSEYDENGFSPKYGYGRVNALKAVQAARASL